MACKFRFGDCHCLIAAALFMIGNFLTFYQDLALHRELFYMDAEEKVYYNDLQPLRLAATWTARFDNDNLQTAAIFVTSFAWIFLAIVLIKLAWVVSAKGTVAIGSSATIVVLALAGSLAELLANLLFLGTNKAMIYIVQTYELNNWIALNGSGFDNDNNNTNPDRRFLQGEAGTDNSTANDGADEDDDEARQAALAGENAGAFAGRDNDDHYDEQEDLADYGDTFVDYADDNAGDDAGDDQNNFDFESIRDDPDDDEFQIDGDFSNSEYNEDGLGWKTLELAYVTSKGMLQLIDSVEFILLAAILVTIFLAVRRGGASFSKAWTYLGLVMAFVAIIQFGLAVSAYEMWDRQNRIAAILLAINHVILLPIWLVWLGWQMKDAAESSMDVSVAAMKDVTEDDFPSSFN
jgi:hypothetical protein